VASREHLKDLFSAPEEDMSMSHPVADFLQFRYTFQESIAVDQYHAHVTRVELTRHIPELMPAIVEELGAALDEEIPLTDGK
jgi:hypothetical protein